MDSSKCHNPNTTLDHTESNSGFGTFPASNCRAKSFHASVKLSTDQTGINSLLHSPRSLSHKLLILITRSKQKMMACFLFFSQRSSWLGREKKEREFNATWRDGSIRSLRYRMLFLAWMFCLGLKHLGKWQWIA